MRTSLSGGPRLREGGHAGEQRQVRAQQAAHAAQRQHQCLVPLLLRAVAAVVHQHGHALAAHAAQDLRRRLPACAAPPPSAAGTADRHSKLDKAQQVHDSARANEYPGIVIIT